MNRIGNIYERICSIENLELADAIARRGKSRQPGIRIHDKNREENIFRLHLALLNKTFKTSAYTTFPVYEPKERLVYKLPYYPDRIVHHAIMNVLEPVFISVFTADTYSCIKGRGIHAAARKLKKALIDESATKYCLKVDITKFYPMVDHDILKALLRRKIKDKDLLWLLDEIIDSAPGLPIGNYLSQYFANFYLTYFDHWIKEVLRVKYYFRYADDLVILADNKPYLHRLVNEIRGYLEEELKLSLKGNYQVFPVASRGIDFLGYVSFHSHVRLRKSIKQNFARMVHRRPNQASIASYWGWAKHCDSKHLIKKLLTHEGFQRVQHQARVENIHWRQDQDQPHPEQGGGDSRIQDRGFKIQGERIWQMPSSSDRNSRIDARDFLRIEIPHGTDSESAASGFPISNNNHEGE